MMFEVQDLAVASPATVSRCGMVYLEPSLLGLAPFIRCWMKKLPKPIEPHKERLEELFYRFTEPCITFVRRKLKEIVTSTDGNLTFSLLKMMECFFSPFLPREVSDYRGESSVGFEGYGHDNLWYFAYCKGLLTSFISFA